MQMVIGTSAVISSYLYFARALRWRRYIAIHRKFGHKYESGLLTPEDAPEIMHVSSLYDMPALMNYALAFALFKIHAIVSRGGDTEDPRAMIALARVAFKVSYQKDDYLYTLALFTFEPAKWARLYGCRALSSMEEEAFYIFWVEIGQRMGIRDIPDSIKDFKQWVMEYESRVMVPAQTNHDVAVYTTEELLHAIPESFGLKIFCPRLMQPELPAYLRAILRTILHTVGFVQGYLCLPRSDSNPGAPIDLPLPQDTTTTVYKTQSQELLRMHPKWFQAVPWYMPEPRTFIGRIKNWVVVKMGLHDALPGPRLKSGGNRLEEMISNFSFH
ncbi:hypothetical protein J3R30DRAFT_3657221 [Lentinula aciculospora]|uniref:ER-bound oxygenase mpaB/mpaB'/Rubber oxygenase catalytic domain-containing protein n=1 Tax=Lentinula aciculospora TaxID=153920 RepID=A0A9W9ACX3_9AGAR|nr:hypothetical protein J3R30DRAFT_3657221 [Lentinula aciculospora]